MFRSFLAISSLDYLKKTQKILQSKLSRQGIAKEPGISYSTVRTMVSRPDRLNYTSWLNVMLLAEYHDRLDLKDSENDDGPARLDLRNTSIVLNGKLFTDEKYQDMSTTAKLIYGYLIRPAQKRYKDEAGRVDEENDFLAKISQSCLIGKWQLLAGTYSKSTIKMIN